jgi:hypothetical protein
MYLIHFDENKFTEECPYFYIGGLLIPGDHAAAIEQTLSRIRYNFFGTDVLSKDTEIHGKEIFHGKGVFKGRKMADRLKLMQDLISLVTENKLAVRMVRIGVKAHREKYRYPEPEYHLGLMLALERFCEYLDGKNEHGVVFGDHEEDEMSRAILDFSQFKVLGKTPMYYGRPLGRLIDTIYFTQSHHSRFLQLTDIVIFLAGRYQRVTVEPEKWHEKQAWNLWKQIESQTDFFLKKWP